MKFIASSQAERMSSGSLSALEYDFATKSLNIAHLTLTGRYPEQGSVTNTLSAMYCLVLAGSGTLYIENTPFELEAGDACLIEPGESYYWDADVTLAIASTPAWTKEQAKESP